MSWTILLTSPQSEFKVRDALIERDIRALVPVEFRLSKRTSGEPIRRCMIPGYCFARVENWAHMQRIDGLRSRPVLMIDGRPAAMPQSAIDALEALSRPLSAIRQHGRRLSPGDRLRVKVGAIADLKATVARVTMQGRPVAIVELFGKSHEVTLEPGQWEAA